MMYSSVFIYLLKAQYFTLEKKCGLLKLVAITQKNVHTASNNIETRMQWLSKKSSHLVYYDDLLLTEHKLNASYSGEYFLNFSYLKI